MEAGGTGCDLEPPSLSWKPHIFLTHKVVGRFKQLKELNLLKTRKSDFHMWQVLWVLCPYPLLLPLQCNQGLKLPVPASLCLRDFSSPWSPPPLPPVRQAAGAKEPAHIAPGSEQPKQIPPLPQPQRNNHAWHLHWLPESLQQDSAPVFYSSNLLDHALFIG